MVPPSPPPRFVPVPPEVAITNDVGEAVGGAAVLAFVVPSHVVRDVARRSREHVPPDIIIVNAAKGIENETLARMSEVLSEELGRPGARRIASLVGPSHAEEVSRHLPTTMVAASVGEDTRTALARITAPNPDRRWKPGMFVSATVVTETGLANVRIPLTALIQMDDGDQVVFVETDEGFEPRPVVLGRRTRDHAEVLSGLEPGERYVATGAFSLKAELGKEAFGEGHGH